MAGSTNDISNIGAFIPTTQVWDVSELYSADVNSEQFKELLVRLYQNVNNIALNINTRESGYFPLFEFSCGQLFFPNPTLNANTSTSPVYRQVYRMVVNFGALPNATSKSVVHNIPVTSNYSAVHVYGAASNANATAMIPLPYASPTLNNNIQVDITNNVVTITTAANYSAYINSYIVIEYIKH